MSGTVPHADIARADADGLRVRFDCRAYDLLSIQKAAYKFGDRCHVLISPDEENTYVDVVLQAKRTLDNPRFLAGEFCNEVLDQQLRQIVAKETAGVRDLLLAQAFSRTNLITPELDSEPVQG